MVQWSETFSVGVAKLDGHHQDLVTIVNKLKEASSQNKGPKELADIAKELRDYTVLHFNAEERVMRQYEYPHLERQRAEHDNFRQVTRDLYSDLVMEKEIDMGATISFLTDWLLEHIGREDKEYGRYFDENGIEVIC